METAAFMARKPRNYKISMETKNIEKIPPSKRHILELNKFIYKNKHSKNITHLKGKKVWRPQSHLPSKTDFDKFTFGTLTTTTTHTSASCRFSAVHSYKPKMSFSLTKPILWLTLWLAITALKRVQSFEMTTIKFQAKDTVTSSSPSPYIPLLSTNGQLNIYGGHKHTQDDDTFRPFVPKIFAPSGQFHVLQSLDTDLSNIKTVLLRKNQHDNINKVSKPFNTSSNPQQVVATAKKIGNRKIPKRNLNAPESARVHRNSLNYSTHTKQQTQQLVATAAAAAAAERYKKTSREIDIKRGEQKPKQKPKAKHIPNSHSKNKNIERNELRSRDDLTTELKSLEDLLIEYVKNFVEKGQYEPLPGLLVELHNNHSQLVNTTRTVRQITAAAAATDAQVRIDLPRTLQTGRLLFLTGLKKVLWPVFMGLQVLKSLLIAMFIPALIGSFTKLLGKGITTGSAPLFIRPMEAPQELDFRDNTFAFEDDNKFLATDVGVKGPYAYNQPDTAHIQYVFDPASANNQLSYTHLGMNERQHQLMQDSYMSALQSIGSASFKNSGSLSSSSSGLLAPMAKKPPPAANVNTFQQFQNVPDSSLLLSNYDPFYSPLLSRLDSVFAQLKINSDKEICREKLICLMYANPAKYAPYSNLVSAQLSRELNELRKPTSDNPDILRFFKYMRAAKDGQDGVDCEKTFDSCTEFKDFDNPAMVSTYHDINKLVQARKLNSK